MTVITVVPGEKNPLWGMLVVSKFVGGFATYDAMNRLLPELSTAVAGLNTTRVVGDEIV